MDTVDPTVDTHSFHESVNSERHIRVEEIAIIARTAFQPVISRIALKGVIARAADDIFNDIA